jgi:hypothetical protein
MKIKIEAWPDSAERAEPVPPENAPPDTAPAPEGRWRLLQVVLSSRDASTEHVTNGGRQDA